jgi:SAM-dependent methyltransferase
VIDPDLQSRLRCPNCRAGRLAPADGDAVLVCQGCSSRFPFARERPILLRRDNPVFTIDDYRDATSANTGRRRIERFIPSPSVNLARGRVLNQLRYTLDTRGIRDVLVVGGGRQRDWLHPLLRASQPHRIVYCDIDTGADVDLFCDGHDLPFVDEAFDAVVTTAVLEHVLYPERVVAEITRVLQPEGLLYSEIPFMQQVHEGAYDFTRYTLSGHRRLFNHFMELDAGMVAGPATALVWAIEHFVLAFVSAGAGRRVAKAVVRLLFSWIKHVDRLLIHRAAAMDGASCTYFLGRKTERPVDDAEIIRRYTGGQRISHT